MREPRTYQQVALDRLAELEAALGDPRVSDTQRNAFALAAAAIRAESHEWWVTLGHHNSSPIDAIESELRSRLQGTR